MPQVDVTECTWETVTVFVRVAVEVIVVVEEVVSAETRRGSASAKMVVRERRILTVWGCCVRSTEFVYMCGRWVYQQCDATGMR